MAQTGRETVISKSTATVTALAVIYSVFHFAWSGVRAPLVEPNIAKFDEQASALLVHLQTGQRVHVTNPVQYGPIFFFIMHPLFRMTDGNRQALATWLYCLQLVCLALSFLLTSATLTRFLRPEQDDWLMITVWLGVLWLNFAPLYTTLAVRSVETWELLFVSLALYAYLREWWWLTAFALAGAGLIKLLPFVLVYYLLVTNRRAFAYSVVCVLAILFVGHALYGPEMGLEYLQHRTGGSLGFSYGLTWHENISLKAAIAKLIGHLEIPPGYIVQLSRLQLTATVLLGDSLVLAGAVLLTRILLRKRGTRSTSIVIWEWSLVVTMMLILSPNTTLEYATLALGAISYAGVQLFTRSRQNQVPARMWICFGGGTLLLGTLIPREILNRILFVKTLNRWTGNTHFTPSEAYQYYCFPLAGLILLALTIWQLKPAASAVSAESESQPPSEDSGLQSAMRFHRKSARAVLLSICALGPIGCSNSQGALPAFETNRRRAEAGDRVAEYNLGAWYSCRPGGPGGQGGQGNEGEAAKWYRKAAEQGLGEAQYQLALQYDDGRGVPRDELQSAFWYLKAAEQGVAAAQRRLGDAYWFGRGVVKDPAVAVSWYRKAADQGDAASTYNLSDVYFRGRPNWGVPQSNFLGYKFLALSTVRLSAKQLGQFAHGAGCPNVS